MSAASSLPTQSGITSTNTMQAATIQPLRLGNAGTGALPPPVMRTATSARKSAGKTRANEPKWNLGASESIESIAPAIAADAIVSKRDDCEKLRRGFGCRQARVGVGWRVLRLERPQLQQ